MFDFLLTYVASSALVLWPSSLPAATFSAISSPCFLWRFFLMGMVMRRRAATGALLLFKEPRLGDACCPPSRRSRHLSGLAWGQSSVLPGYSTSGRL